MLQDSAKVPISRPVSRTGVGDLAAKKILETAQPLDRLAEGACFVWLSRTGAADNLQLLYT